MVISIDRESVALAPKPIITYNVEVNLTNLSTSVSPVTRGPFLGTSLEHKPCLRVWDDGSGNVEFFRARSDPWVGNVVVEQYVRKQHLDLHL